MKTPIHYARPFSNGQITIPKPIRQAMGIEDKSWLKFEAKGDQLIISQANPTTNLNQSKYANALRQLNTDWFDAKDYQQIKKSWPARAKKYDY